MGTKGKAKDGKEERKGNGMERKWNGKGKGMIEKARKGMVGKEQ